MRYNLTEKQKEMARFLAEEIREGNLPESFFVIKVGGPGTFYLPQLKPGKGTSSKIRGIEWPKGQFDSASGTFRSSSPGANVEGHIGELDVLAQSNLLCAHNTGKPGNFVYTITGSLFTAVETNFKDDQGASSISALAQSYPAEISVSLERLRTKYPDPKRFGFLIMRFINTAPYPRIVEVIKKTAEGYGLNVVRADENQFHDDLWGNVRTYLHGCGFGVAVYERIESEEPNANVGLEVGYLMAMNKPVLLLKDRTAPILQTDLAGKLYKEFDPHDPEGTIPDQLARWLQDYGIVVSP